MNPKLISILLTFLAFFISCEKDEPLNIENTDIPLLSKVIIDSELYYEYTYNNANLISEEKSKLHYTKHHYNDKNQLTSTDFYWDNSIFSSCSYVVDSALQRKEWVNPENTNKSGYNTFEYNNIRQLLKLTTYRLTTDYETYSKFSYDYDGRISRQFFYYEDKVSGYIDYLYDDRGNISIKYKYYVSDIGDAELSTTTKYEFDNKHNPYKSFKRLLLPGINTNQNNIIKETYTIHFEVDPYIDTIQITETSYEYNDREYPIRKNKSTEYVYK